jgi:hypothetical protein
MGMDDAIDRKRSASNYHLPREGKVSKYKSSNVIRRTLVRILRHVDLPDLNRISSCWLV